MSSFSTFSSILFLFESTTFDKVQFKQNSDSKPTNCFLLKFMNFDNEKKNRESKLQIIKEILRLYHLFCLLIYFFVSGRKAKYMKNQINRCIKKNQTEGHNKQI